MDIKSLSDEELDSLLDRVKAEIETRRVCSAAPALIQQTALRALALGASATHLQQALKEVLEIPVETSSPVEETPAESVEPPVESTPEEPVVAPDPETPGGTS